MLSIDLPKDIEKDFIEVVQKSYSGNIKLAITSMLKLYEKFKWKDQLKEDVESIRIEMRRKGGIRSKNIDKAIKRYRKKIA